MACYATWLPIAFFNVIAGRFKFQLLSASYAHPSGRRREFMIHAAIWAGALGVSLGAAAEGVMETRSGIIACWVSGPGPYGQLYYYYIWMTIALTVGVVHSVVATMRVWRILRGAGTEEVWTVAHRPLRRVGR